MLATITEDENELASAKDVVVVVIALLWRLLRATPAGTVFFDASDDLHAETSIATPSSNDTIRGCEVSRLIVGGGREEDEEVLATVTIS